MSDETLRFPAAHAPRWSTCLASSREQLRYPKLEQDDEERRKGIAAHTHFASIAETGESLLGEEIEGILIDDVMHCEIMKSLDYVKTLIPNAFTNRNITKMVETAVDISQWTIKGNKAYIDLLIFDDDKKALHVFDLKYGHTVVNAENNPQLYLYTLGAIEEWDMFHGPFDDIFVHILQPRMNHFDTHWIKESSLAKWGSVLRDTVKRIVSTQDLPFSPSDSACRYCNARDGCRALADKGLSTLSDDFSDIASSFHSYASNPDIDLHRIPSLTADEVFNIYHNADVIKVFLKAIEKKAATLLHNGEQPDNCQYKLVNKRGNRKWIDADKAEKALARAGLNIKQRKTISKVISPNQAQGLLLKKYSALSKYEEWSPGSTTMVPVSDKRPAVDSLADAIEGFEEVLLIAGETQTEE